MKIMDRDSFLSAEEVIERLKATLRHNMILVKTDLDLAKILGVGQQTVSGWKARNKIPYEFIVEQVHGLSEDRASLDEIILGRWNVREHWIFPPFQSAPGVPYGMDPHGPSDAAWRLLFSRHARTPDGPRPVLIEAADDTMEQTVKKGDLLAVDTRAVLESPGIYVLEIDEKFAVRRLLPAGETVEVICDNTIYPQSSSPAGRLKVVGRVLKILRDAT
jgi:hypothetical protein